MKMLFARRLLLGLSAVALLAPALAGCSGFGSSAELSAQTQSGSVSPSPKNIAQEKSGPTQTVPLKVVHAQGGATLALIPVTIEGQGPFAFALDTGASNSTIDTSLAQKLALPRDGSAGQVTGVAAQTQANFVAVQSWKIGAVALPPRKVIAVELGGQDAQSGLQGLIGSDILSGFGAVTVDYEKQELIVRPAVKQQKSPAASAS